MLAYMDFTGGMASVLPNKEPEGFKNPSGY
jgi:hypothetical protein